MAHTRAALALVVWTASAFADETVQPFISLPVAVGGNWSETSLYRVFRTEDEFVAGWPRTGRCDDQCVRALIAPVDFAREMVVVIAPRERGQAAYDVTVTEVTQTQDSIDVSFLELRRGPSQGDMLCAVITVMPNPIALIAIPQSDLPVRFQRSRADVLCEPQVEVR